MLESMAEPVGISKLQTHAPFIQQCNGYIRFGLECWTKIIVQYSVEQNWLQRRVFVWHFILHTKLSSPNELSMYMLLWCVVKVILLRSLERYLTWLYVQQSTQPISFTSHALLALLQLSKNGCLIRTKAHP